MFCSCLKASSCSCWVFAHSTVDMEASGDPGGTGGVQSTEYTLQNTDYRIQIEYRAQNIEYEKSAEWRQSTEYITQNTQYRNQTTEYRNLYIEYCIQNTYHSTALYKILGKLSWEASVGRDMGINLVPPVLFLLMVRFGARHGNQLSSWKWFMHILPIFTV